MVLAPGAALSEAELIARCKEEMAGYKYPRLAEFFDVLPTNATGEILKRELREAGAAARTAATGNGQQDRRRPTGSAGGFIRPAERCRPLR